MMFNDNKQSRRTKLLFDQVECRAPVDGAKALVQRRTRKSGHQELFLVDRINKINIVTIL